MIISPHGIVLPLLLTHMKMIKENKNNSIKFSSPYHYNARVPYPLSSSYTTMPDSLFNITKPVIIKRASYMNVIILYKIDKDK